MEKGRKVYVDFCWYLTCWTYSIGGSMKKSLLSVILLGIITSGCSTDIDLAKFHIEEDGTIQFDAAEKTKQDSTFKPYVEVWRKVTGDTRVAANIQFVDELDRPTAIGNCKSHNSASPIFGDLAGSATGEKNNVTILRSRWETLGENQRQLLIFHELGHCEFFFGHNEKDNHDVMFDHMLFEEQLISKTESGYTLFEYIIWRSFGYIEDERLLDNFNDPLESFYYDTHGTGTGGFDFYKTIHPDWGVPEVAKEWAKSNKPLFDIPDVDDLEIDNPTAEDLIPEDTNPEDFLPAA